MEIEERGGELVGDVAVLLLLVFEVLESEDGVHLLARRAAELATLLGRDGRRQIRLFQFDVAPQLVVLHVAHVVGAEADDRLDPVAQLAVPQVVQQPANLQLHPFRQIHLQQSFAVLVFTLSINQSINE